MRIHSKFLIFVRFDGFEQMAFIVGTALSPVLFRCAGYEGAFRWDRDSEGGRGQHNTNTFYRRVADISWPKHSLLALVHATSKHSIFASSSVALSFPSWADICLNAECYCLFWCAGTGPMWGVANEGQLSRQYVAKNDNLSKHLWTSHHISLNCVSQQPLTSDLREQAALVFVCNSNAQNSCCQVAYNALNYTYT